MSCNCRYTVVVNMPGYLPESDPTCHSTMASAKETAKYEREQPGTAGVYVVEISTFPVGFLAGECQCEECQ